MNAEEIRFHTLTRLRRELRHGSLNPTELARVYADSAQADTAGLRAVLCLCADLEDQAAAADASRPLGGLPILIKDNIITAGGEPTTCGSLALEEWIPGEDAPLVKGLRRAGALIQGKANLSEWANYRSTTSSSGWSSVGGQTRNPHVLNRDPSGSSSGSAVAVSAGLCAGAVGTETDGSITAPACRNGTVGVKPTVGLVSRTGIIPISHRQDTAGPLTHSVADAALMLQAMAGPDAADEATAAIPDGYDFGFPDHLDAADLKGVRIGVLGPPDWLAPEAAPVYADAVQVLRGLGAELKEGLQLPDGDWGEQEALALKTEFKEGLNRFLASQSVTPPIDDLEELIAFNRRHADRVMPVFGQELHIQAQDTDPADPAYAQAVEDLARLAGDECLLHLLDGQRLDLIAAPSGNPSGVIDHIYGSRIKGGFSSPAAVAGFPHVSIPMGAVRHMPVGLSLVGRPFSEMLLLQVADAFERALDLGLRPQFIPSLEDAAL